MSTNTSWQPPSWLKTARPRSRLSQLWQVPMFLVGLIALVVVCTGAVERHGQQQQKYLDRLALVRQALKDQDGSWSKLLPMAEALVDQAGYYPSHAGEAHFLLGSILMRLAEDGPAEQARAGHELALSHFQQAETIGVAQEDRLALWFQLGKALHRTGGNRKQVIDYLDRALPKGADDPAAGYGLLAKLNLELPVPDLDAALRANKQQIDLTNDDMILMPARLLRAELFIQKKQYDDALHALERVGPNAPESSWHKALYLQAFCYEAQGMWAKAAPLWEKLIQWPDVVPGGKKHILFALGNCHGHANPPAEQKAIQAWQEAQKEGGPEGQAAALRLAEMYLSGSQPDRALAVHYFQLALADVTSEMDYNNPLIPLDEVRELVEYAIGLAHDNGAHEQAQQFTHMYQKLGAPGSADLKLAEISVNWAKSLEAKAAQVSGAAAESLKQKAHLQWTLAAQSYLQAAQAKTDNPKQADHLWHSIQCFRSAAENAKAIDLLKDYLKLNLAVDDQARGWFTLGAAYHALGQMGESENAYMKCWEFSTSPFSYRARYQLALDKIAAKEFDQAEKILRQNIKIQGPHLDREAHEKSLYLLAGLLHQRGNFTQAYLWLEEAMQRYPDNPDIFAVRDLLGDSYLQLARQLKKKIEEQKPGLAATALTQLKKNWEDWVDKAARTYEQLADDLKALPEAQALTPQHVKLCRKAMFTKADILLYQMENYTEALRRYQELTILCKGQFEELLACQRLWTCCLALQYQPKEREAAQTALAAAVPSAKSTLPQLPDEFFQGGAGSWTRKDWQNFLAQVETSLKQNPTNAEKPHMP